MTQTTNALAIHGGSPVRTTPLPTGFFGMRLVGDEEKAEVIAALDARAIMPVHIHGAACRIDAIVSVAQRHDLRVIENGAWSMGASFHGQSIGTFGDAGIHSLQSVKVITAGEGGVVLTADPVLYERA